MGRESQVRVRVAVVVVVLTALASNPGGSAAIATTFADPDTIAVDVLDESISSRALFGWPTDSATISRLRSGEDVGTAEWGIAMTSAEEADLRSRMANEQNLEAKLLPFVRALPTSGGAWIDQLDGGKLVVTLTTSDQATRTQITQLLPANSRGIRFELVDDTETELEAAAHAADEMWEELGSNARLLGVTVDIPRNQIVLRFVLADLPIAVANVDEVQSALGVTVSMEADEPPIDAACTSRANCFTPLKPGIHVHNDGMPTGNGNICTMGFHITIGTDEQFVTSGHCGIRDPENDWNHSVNYGFVGNEIANLIGEDGYDIMRVGLLDSQATTLIYGQSGTMTGWAAPSAGMAIKVSLGWGSNTVKTGTVTAVSMSWDSSVCGCEVWGGDASWTTVGGDSGSPVYRVVGSSLIAIGANANVPGNFAKIVDAWTGWGTGGIYCCNQ